ncbi:MAG: DUF58 domain-containing protein [Deltaproteobacteria bacterium]|nr:DUF58 domain-containing protein [Deltaproteobacteria bacterium]
MIPRELIRKVRRIEIRTNRLVNEMLAGQYQSVFKGRGMAFEEVRQYFPGDDIRLIDWNVSARMNDAYVKLFVEEREMTVMLLVDMSASGDFGSAEQVKRELAAEMAALLAFSAIKNNDRVGLIIFTDRVEKFVPPKKGAKHVLRVITEILNFRPEHKGTDLNAALEFLGYVSRRRSVAFLFSDFLASDYEHSLKVAHKRHDLVPVVITDPVEERVPDVGVLMVEDLETGRVMAFDTSARAVGAYRRRVAQIREWREAMFRRRKIDFINVRTDKPYVQALVQFFRMRERRMRR